MRGIPFFQSCTDQRVPSLISCSRSRANSKSTMDVRWFPRLVVMACILPTSLGCPSACRCYSLTVECGSLGLKEIPQGLPSATEVSRPIHIKWAHIAPRVLSVPHQHFSSEPPTLIHSHYLGIIQLNLITLIPPPFFFLNVNLKFALNSWF